MGDPNYLLYEERRSIRMLNAIIFGCLGGLLPDILRIIKSRYKSKIPQYLTRFNFWLGIILLVIIGGLTAWLMGAEGPKEAIAFGFAAPEVISKLAAKSVETVDRGEIPFRLRQWWAN